MWLKSSFKYAGGLLLALALLAWVLRGTEPRAIWDQLRQASVWGLVAASLLNVGHNVFRVWRWRALLVPVRPAIPFRPMFHAVILGYMTSWVVPGRLGELVRPALLAARERLPLGPCLGSVIADRLLDGLAVLVLFAAGVLFTPLAAESAEHLQWIRGGSLVLVALIGVPLVILMVASASRVRLDRWVRDRRGIRPWLGRVVLSISEGIDALKQPALLARVGLHTLLAWLTIAVATWLGVRACGAAIPFGAILVILPLLVLGIALPTPGGAGGYHAAMTFGLTQLFAVSEPVAVGASFVMHAIVVLPVVLLGAVFLVVDRIPFHDLLEAGRQVRLLGSSVPRDALPDATAEKLS